MKKCIIADVRKSIDYEKRKKKTVFQNLESLPQLCVGMESQSNKTIYLFLIYSSGSDKMEWNVTFGA